MYNSFAPCFYIAYVKDAIGDECVDGSCLGVKSQFIDNFCFKATGG